MIFVFTSEYPVTYKKFFTSHIVPLKKERAGKAFVSSQNCASYDAPILTCRKADNI